MNKQELMANGDAAVRKALAGTCVILNENGEMLSKLEGDKMIFSPVLECDEKCSVMVFDDPVDAQKTIEDILEPQDGQSYNIFRFTPIDDIVVDDDGDIQKEDDGDDGIFEIEYDDDDDDDDEMSIDDAIQMCRDIAASSDEETAKEHMQIAELLEKLKEFEDEDDGGDGEDGDDVSLDESVTESPTIHDAQRIFKRNGYQLVSQRNSCQKWMKDGDEYPITIPLIFESTEQIPLEAWKGIVGSHNLVLDV